MHAVSTRGDFCIGEPPISAAVAAFLVLMAWFALPRSLMGRASRDGRSPSLHLFVVPAHEPQVTPLPSPVSWPSPPSPALLPAAAPDTMFRSRRLAPPRPSPPSALRARKPNHAGTARLPPRSAVPPFGREDSCRPIFDEGRVSACVTPSRVRPRSSSVFRMSCKALVLRSLSPGQPERSMRECRAGVHPGFMGAFPARPFTKGDDHEA